jgi:hypothetical protein
MLVNNTTKEEIEDYFLELYDMSMENDPYSSKISIIIDSNTFISVRAKSEPRKSEVICEAIFDNQPICKPYIPGDLPFSNNFKIVEKRVEYPITYEEKNLNTYSIRVQYPNHIEKKVEKIVNISINRINRYYDISDKTVCKPDIQRGYPDIRGSMSEIKFKLSSKEEYQKFKNFIQDRKETHDIKISNYVSGIDNYYPMNINNIE